MPNIKYIGLSHFRELLAADFAKVGVSVGGAVVFARHEVTKVTTEIATALQELLGDEFEIVKDDVEQEVRDLTSHESAEPQPQMAMPMTDSDNPDEVDHPDGHLAPEGQL